MMTQNRRKGVHQLLNMIERFFIGQRVVQRTLARIVPDAAYADLVLRHSEAKGNRYAEKTVVCFVRRLFDKDIEQLQYRLRDYRWLCVPTTMIAWPQTKHLPQHYMNQTQYSEFVNDTAAWSPCIEFASTFLEAAIRKYGAIACLDANIDYWQTYAFCKAARTKNLPFLVLSKENPVTATAIENYRRRYKDYSFQGSAIACPSESLRKVFRELNLIDEEHLWLTGYPRLDRYRAIDFADTAKNTIVFLSFLQGYGLRSSADYQATLNIIRATVADCNGSQTARIVIKTKNLPDSIAHRGIPLIEKWGKQDSMITVTHDANLFDCFGAARVVIGANSQSLVEALLTDVPIVVPQWAIAEDPAQNFFSTEENLQNLSVYISRTTKEFREHIEECLHRAPAKHKHAQIKKARLKLVNRFVVFEPVRSASSAVAEMIEHYARS